MLIHNSSASTPALLVKARSTDVHPFPEQTLTQSQVKKNKKEAPTSHWMTNAGYGVYAGVGALKTIASLSRAVGHDNPTLIVGNVALLASMPAVFMTHGFYAKAGMLVANHLSEMAEAALGYNDRVSSAANEANKNGYTVPHYNTTGLVGMKQWLNWGLVFRSLTLQSTVEDQKNIRAFWGYVGNDLKAAAYETKQTIQAGGTLIAEWGKKLVNPSHRIQVPERFAFDTLANGDVKNIGIQQNLYNAERTGAFSGIIGVGVETLATTLGLGQASTFLTRPALLVANLLQTTGALCAAKQICLRTDAHKRQDPEMKRIGLQEAGGTVLEAIGAASWSNDWLLGIYRLGSLLRMPYRKLKTMLVKNANGGIEKVKELTPKIKRALLVENLSFGADGIAAVLILGAPLVAWWERTHHTTLNPVARYNAHEKTDTHSSIQKKSLTS